jgi:SAM-dependent methyltransferase
MTDSFYQYLRDVQYKDPSNLDARASLHERYSWNRRGLHRWIFDIFLERTSGRILEVGSGPGHLWRRNLSRIPNSLSVFLSDVSQGMIETARNELSSHLPHFHYAVIDAQTIPFSSRKFEAIIANHMIYHLPDIPRALEEMYRVLVSDGCLYATTNDDDHLKEIVELVHSIEPSLVFGSRDLLEDGIIPFGMGNGAGLLSKVFDEVEKYAFDDELVITDAQPLVEYILSFPGNAHEVFSHEDKLTELIARIEEKIRNEGAFKATKSAGMFIATKK